IGSALTTATMDPPAAARGAAALGAAAFGASAAELGTDRATASSKIVNGGDVRNDFMAVIILDPGQWRVKRLVGSFTKNRDFDSRSTQLEISAPSQADSAAAHQPSPAVSGRSAAVPGGSTSPSPPAAPTSRAAAVC